MMRSIKQLNDLFEYTGKPVIVRRGLHVGWSEAE